MIEPLGAPRLQPVPGRTPKAKTEETIPDQFQASPQLERTPKLAQPREDAPALPRPMTADEKEKYQGWFPHLDVDKSRVTGEQTRRYNCISWTTGNIKSWDWPPAMYPEVSDRAAFGLYYRDRGFTPISAEEAAQLGSDREVVAYWEDPSEPTHGSVSGPAHLDRWESKCGSAARLTHDRDELESTLYGAIKGYYVRTAQAPQPPPPPSQGWTRRLEAKLENRLAAVPVAVQRDFAEAYAQWDQQRQSPEISAHSNPKFYCQGQGFARLRQLGPESLPLLIEKMQQGDFFCHYLAEAISDKKSDFKIAGSEPLPTLAPLRVCCSEQDKSQQVLDQWLDSSW